MGNDPTTSSTAFRRVKTLEEERLRLRGQTTEIRLHRGTPTKLIASYGPHLFVKPAGFVPEVVDHSSWSECPISTEAEFCKAEDEIMYGKKG